jgi:hypothetical protein
MAWPHMAWHEREKACDRCDLYICISVKLVIKIQLKSYFKQSISIVFNTVLATPAGYNVIFSSNKSKNQGEIDGF